MSALRITLYEGVPDGLVVPATSGAFFVYAPDGGVAVGAQVLAADEGAFAAPGTAIVGDALAWCYEVAAASAPFAAGLDLLRSQRLALDFSPPFLVRADRIESQPGAVTPRHGHQGPGIRRLIMGCLMAEVGDTTERVDAGHSWFETGRDMVVGSNIGATNAAFVRMMVLPIALEGGKSSFMPADAAEAAKPRSVAGRLFGETTFTPAG